MRAAELEDPRRVDEDAQPLGVEVGRQQRVDDVLDQVGAQLLVEVDAAGVLGRDQHGVDADRLAVLVDDRHLRLAVGAQVRHGAGPTHLGQPLGEPVRQPDRQRHEIRRLVAGVAEHHSLVSGALGVQRVLAAGTRAELERGVDALRDVRRLRVERHEDATGLAVEAVAVVVVADGADRLAHQRRDVDIGRGRHLARHHDEPRRQQRLAGHTARRITLENGVQDGIRDLVRHLVGVTLGDRLRGECGLHALLRFCVRWLTTLSNTAFATASLEVSGISAVSPFAPRMTTALVS